MLTMKVYKGVVLAAGCGSRLGQFTTTCPKVLLPIRGRVLISYAIEALAVAGITEIAIVIGYLGDQVINALGDSMFGVTLHYIFNDDYLGGSAISVYKARDWANGEPIALCMGDHLIDKTLVSRLLDGIELTDTLCIDYDLPKGCDIAEATKVMVDDRGYIKNIGKELTRYNALDTGVFLLTENFFWATGELISTSGINAEMSDVVNFLINKDYSFHTCDVSGCLWADIDTEEDLNTLEITE